MNLFNGLEKIINDKLFDDSVAPVDNIIKHNNLFECDDKKKNHFYFENLTDDGFFDSSGAKKEFVLFYKRVIKSGVGTVILGGINLSQNSKNSSKVARISLDENIISEYKKIVFYAHSARTKIILKLNAGIGRFYHQNKGKELNYGVVLCLKPENKQKIMLRASDNRCNELINEISKTVLLANISGFDGIMIDASYSNLIGELTSPELNKRFFGYFSSCEDFLKKTLKSIDSKNNTIYLKLSILTLFDNENDEVDLFKINSKINLDKITENLMRFIEWGIDGFEFVFGRWENNFFINHSCFMGGYIFSDFIKEFRNYLTNNNIKNKFGGEIEIFYKDNFKDFSSVNELVKTNVVDYIDITKNIYSDLNFISKTKNAKHIKNCLKCSYCNQISKENNKIECAINPELTNFEDVNYSKNGDTIAIVGAGISGLTCALTLAKRGYKVQLFEKNNCINYYGKLTTIFNFDKALFSYYEKIESEIQNMVKNKKIIIDLNKEFVSSDFRNQNYYSIVIATGFKSKFLAIPGSVQSHVINIYDSLKNKEILLSKKKIVIYARSILSLKLALFLANNKKNVTLIINDIKLLNLNKNADLFYYLCNLHRFGVNFYYFSRITHINEDNVSVLICKNLDCNSVKVSLDIFSNVKLNMEKQLTNIDCDYLIYEPEFIPNNGLYADLVKSGYKGELYLIGNALENSSLAEHIKSGYFVGKNL